MDLNSFVPGILWSDIPHGGRAALLAMQFQLDQTQRWPQV